MVTKNKMNVTENLLDDMHSSRRAINYVFPLSTKPILKLYTFIVTLNKLANDFKIRLFPCSKPPLYFARNKPLIKFQKKIFRGEE